MNTNAEAEGADKLREMYAREEAQQEKYKNPHITDISTTQLKAELRRRKKKGEI